MSRMDPQEILTGIIEMLPSNVLKRFDPKRIVEACPECTCPLHYRGMSGPYTVFTCPKCEIPFVGVPGKLRSCAKPAPAPPSAQTIAAREEERQRRADAERCDHDWSYSGQNPHKCRKCGLLFGTGDSAEQLAREQERQRTDDPVIPETTGVDDVPDPGGRRFCPHCGNAPDQGHMPQCPHYDGESMDDETPDDVAADDVGETCEHLVWVQINQYTQKCRDCGVRKSVGAETING